MLRFVLERKQFDAVTGMLNESLVTMLIDVPELEHWLTGGGHGPSGYDYTRLVGVEINPHVGDSNGQG